MTPCWAFSSPQQAELRRSWERFIRCCGVLRSKRKIDGLRLAVGLGFSARNCHQTTSMVYGVCESPSGSDTHPFHHRRCMDRLSAAGEVCFVKSKAVYGCSSPRLSASSSGHSIRRRVRPAACFDGGDCMPYTQLLADCTETGSYGTAK
jgi:hypothetical protein